MTAVPQRKGWGRLAGAAIGVAVVSLLGVACGQKGQELPAIGGDLSRTSVSGLSSGAYMAGQFQLAHSRIVIGAGIVAGGPFGCAQSAAAEASPFWAAALPYNTAQALNGCMADRLGAFGVLDARRLAARAERLADQGKIGPLADVRDDRIYLFSGQRDETVAETVVAAARDFYLEIGVPRENIVFHRDMPAGHLFVTEDTGVACERSAPPWLGDCDYDQARAILAFIYGDLAPATDPADNSFIRFSQRPYGALDGASMDDEGFAYVPASCREKPGCAVHVAFHGCRQGASEVGDAFVKGSGFARWAEANRIVLLFPQLKPSTLNPRGCWDWWGYTGPDFLTKDAPQIRIVYRMLEALAASGER